MTERFYPDTLRRMPIWVLWKTEERDGRTTKVPYSTKYMGRASSVAPQTWSSFDEASLVYDRNRSEYKGIGVMISKLYRLLFIDVDHCIAEDGTMDERALDILDAFPDQYAEVSQSGTGIHIITMGEISKSFKNSNNGVEMYDDKRFCAMTGLALTRGEPHESPSAVSYVFNRYRTPRRTENIHMPPGLPLMRSDREIVEKASSSREKFRELYAGDWKAGYGSHSEADAAMCAFLAFWTDADPERMDRIFRTSGLYREKWEREDYRKNTILHACSFCEETYSEYITRMNREEMTEREHAYLARWSRSCSSSHGPVERNQSVSE